MIENQFSRERRKSGSRNGFDCCGFRLTGRRKSSRDCRNAAIEPERVCCRLLAGMCGKSRWLLLKEVGNVVPLCVNEQRTRLICAPAEPHFPYSRVRLGTPSRHLGPFTAPSVRGCTLSVECPDRESGALPASSRLSATPMRMASPSFDLRPIFSGVSASHILKVK